MGALHLDFCFECLNYLVAAAPNGMVPTGKRICGRVDVMLTAGPFRARMCVLVQADTDSACRLHACHVMTVSGWCSGGPAS